MGIKFRVLKFREDLNLRVFNFADFLQSIAIKSVIEDQRNQVPRFLRFLSFRVFFSLLCRT